MARIAAASDASTEGLEPSVSDGEPATPDLRRRGRYRVVRSAWLWPALLVLVSGLVNLSRPVMWQDELVTLNVAPRTVGQILALLKRVDAAHGAYYLFMHFWTAAFGESAFSVRLPSTLAMAGAAACVALIGQRLFGTATGVCAGLTFALAPSVLRFSQETRSYGFVVLFSAVSSLLLLYALDRPTVPRWAGYALALAATAAVNLVALTILFGHVVAVLVVLDGRAALLRPGPGGLLRLGRGRPLLPEGWLRPLVGFGAAVCVGLLLASPVINRGRHQARSQIGWIGKGPVWTAWQQMFASSLLPWGLLVLAALAVLGAFRISGTRRPLAVVASIAVLPPLVVWLASQQRINYFFSKYLLFCLPAWSVLGGAGLVAVARLLAARFRPVAGRTAWVMAAGLVVLAGLALPGQLAMRADLSHSWYTYPEPRAFPALDYRAAAKVIESDYRPGDGVVYLRGPLWWWMNDVGVPYYLPPDVHPRDVFLAESAALARNLHPLECRVPADCLGNEQRLWVVLEGTTEDPVGGLSRAQRAAIAPHYAVAWIKHPPGMTVALLTRTG